MKTTLLMLLFVAAASPALADPHRANRAEPAMTCDRVARAQGEAVPGESGLTRAAADRRDQVLFRSTQPGKFRSS
jgi:hypothetical protein